MVERLVGAVRALRWAIMRRTVAKWTSFAHAACGGHACDLLQCCEWKGLHLRSGPNRSYRGAVMLARLHACLRHLHVGVARMNSEL